MTSNPLPVSIIIPSYNSEEIIATTLESILRAVNAYAGQNEIIVVDDASQDNSVRLIGKLFPEVKTVQHETNKGFSEAVLSGVTASSFEIVILLNSDVRPDREFIAPLVQWFAHDDTFSVSPVILSPSGEPARVSWNLVKLVRGEIRKHDWDFDSALKLSRERRPLKSLFASGGSMAVKKEMFLQLDGFLPLYKPFYYEDCDLGTRAWQHGWKTYFEPNSSVIHDHQQGTIKRFYKAQQIKITKKRNRLFYLWLHLSTPKLVFSHIPWALFRLLTRLIRLDIVYAMGFFKALSAIGNIRRLRKKMASLENYQFLEDIISKINT